MVKDSIPETLKLGHFRAFGRLIFKIFFNHGEDSIQKVLKLGHFRAFGRLQVPGPLNVGYPLNVTLRFFTFFFSKKF